MRIAIGKYYVYRWRSPLSVCVCVCVCARVCVRARDPTICSAYGRKRTFLRSSGLRSHYHECQCGDNNKINKSDRTYKPATNTNIQIIVHIPPHFECLCVWAFRTGKLTHSSISWIYSERVLPTRIFTGFVTAICYRSDIPHGTHLERK